MITMSAYIDRLGPELRHPGHAGQHRRDREPGRVITIAMFELNWASFEPRPGVVSASYLATMRSYLRVYRAAGQLVTLGLGLQNPPS
jgi:hypothetical protein